MCSEIQRILSMAWMTPFLALLVQFLNSGGVVSLCDDVVLFLVLLRVDRCSGEGFVRVPDQTQRVNGSFHQMFVDDLRCLLLPECLSSKLVESFVNWGEEGEGSVNKHLVKGTI